MRVVNPVAKKFFSSRKTWTVLVAIAVRVSIAAGFDSKLAQDVGDQILILAGVLVAAIAFEDAAEKRAQQPPATTTTTIVTPPSPPPPQQTPEVNMNAPSNNGPKIGVILMLLAAGALLTAGCAKSPTAKWAQARSTLTTTQNTLISAHRAGKISDADFVALDPFVQAARGALDRAHETLPEGGATFDFYLKLVEDVLTQLAGIDENPAATREVSHERASDSSGAATRPAAAGLRDPAGFPGEAERGVHRRAA